VFESAKAVQGEDKPRERGEVQRSAEEESFERGGGGIRVCV